MSNAVTMQPKSMAEALAELSRLQQVNRELEAKAASTAHTGKITLRVSVKGALSVYGMGRWPVTLYKSQWERLISEVPSIQAFIAANAATLAVKAE